MQEWRKYLLLNITVWGIIPVFNNPRDGGYIVLAIHGPLWAVHRPWAQAMGHSHIYTLTPPAVWITGAAVYKTSQQRKKLTHKAPHSHN
jgi:hypothetical protein